MAKRPTKNNSGGKRNGRLRPTKNNSGGYAPVNLKHATQAELTQMNLGMGGGGAASGPGPTPDACAVKIMGTIEIRVTTRQGNAPIVYAEWKLQAKVKCTCIKGYSNQDEPMAFWGEPEDVWLVWGHGAGGGSDGWEFGFKFDIRWFSSAKEFCNKKEIKTRWPCGKPFWLSTEGVNLINMTVEDLRKKLDVCNEKPPYGSHGRCLELVAEDVRDASLDMLAEVELDHVNCPPAGTSDG